MQSFGNNSNYQFVNLNMFEIPIYISEPAGLPGYLSPNHFVISHNQNDSIKKLITDTINYAVNNYKETYNTKFKEAIHPSSKISDVVINQLNPFNWVIICQYVKPIRQPFISDRGYETIVKNTPSQTHFEINIYKNNETEYTIEFKNLNHAIDGYFELFIELEKCLREGLNTM